ncbi:MAG: RnfH family protein [Gammaproteobacteria bacterium]|jgi:putative ubiquitin-RnfH superfamily antitoxin RatB of RatAB toxin-antitoxin module
MAVARQIAVEVAHARPERQLVLRLDVPEGTTVLEAVRRSGILERFPSIDLAHNRLGVFGKLVKPDQVLREGDRVEIYRPLVADPKEARRRRAAAGRTMGRETQPPAGRGSESDAEDTDKPLA